MHEERDGRTFPARPDVSRQAEKLRDVQEIAHEQHVAASETFDIVEQGDPGSVHPPLPKASGHRKELEFVSAMGGQIFEEAAMRPAEVGFYGADAEARARARARARDRSSAHLSIRFLRIAFNVCGSAEPPALRIACPTKKPASPSLPPTS